MKTTILISALALSAFGLASAAAPTADDGSTCSSGSYAAKPGGKTIVETALAAGQFNTLAAALTAADLVEPLSGKGPFTVFAPTDDAFAKLPKGTVESLLKKENRAALTNILTYHVTKGLVPAAKVVKLTNGTALNGQRFPIQVGEDGVQIAGVNVVKTDIKCSNGIIHVIDAVMMPATKNIVETAATTDGFSTLVAAVGAADLAEVLGGKGPFTVFAPTDDAFAALPDGTVESLLKPENKDQLISILKYHVVSGRIYSDQLKNGAVATLQGSPIHVKLSEHEARLNDSTVVAANIENTNGVIHVIDRVLLPR